MRGTHVAGAEGVEQSGIIPAYEGNTKYYREYAPNVGDHPRVCGEHRNTVPSVQRMTGSSPRMRGTQQLRVSHGEFAGIIPAYAGNTFGHSVGFAGNWDHPRVCGEHHACHPNAVPDRGSSPRMRGTLRYHTHALRKTGIIPAYAGNTRRPLADGWNHWDHPRVCGEHRLATISPATLSGSSPRMRGTLKEDVAALRQRGIIPAYAGNTRCGLMR